MPASAPDANGRFPPAVWLAGAACLAIVLALVLLTGRRSHPQAAASGQPSGAQSLPDFEVKPVSVEEGVAKWYDVPGKTLAQRRSR